jgi:hypothetical protein
MRYHFGWGATAVLVSLLAHPTPSTAQASRTGPTFVISAPPNVVSALPDSAYDYRHDRYFVVSEVGHVAIHGTLLDAAGNPLAGLVVRQSGIYAQNPRVAFGPHVNNGAGGYLVTWHENLTEGVAQVWGRLISADGAAISDNIAIGTDTTGAPGTSSNWLMGAAVSYSTVSHEFLVAWMAGYTAANDIRFMRLNAAGALLQSVPTTITAGTVDWERDPSVAYNQHQDEFYIAYAGWVNAGNYGTVNGQRVKAGTGALLGGANVFGAFAAPLIPAVAYNSQTRQYVVTWYNRTSASAAMLGITVNGADGATASAIRLMSGYYFAYDALDFDYNVGSGDFLMITHGRDEEDAGVSVRADGTPYDNGFVVTDTVGVHGNFHPRLAASATGRYLAVTSGGFSRIHGQFVQGSGGTAPPPPPPPPPPSTPDTRLYVDSPQNSATVAGQLSISGWAIDLNSSSGTGVDAIHAYAFPVTGGQIFLGAASVTQRLDVASHFGNTRFTNSGFALTASLPPGVYNVGVYARSTVTGTFNTVWTVQIRVTPPSNPVMAIDQPRPEWSGVPSSFWIRGWALDTSSFIGPGVDAIHAWAYPVLPTGYGAPIFAGSTTIGGHRPDVAAAFGNAQFATAGFDMIVTLPPGVYDVVVYARSWIAGSFNNWRIVRVTTQ